MEKWHVSKKIILWKDSQQQKRLEYTQQRSIMAAKNEELSVVTYNCRGLTASLHDIKQFCAMHHIIFLHKTWLAKQTLDKLTDISDNQFYLCQSWSWLHKGRNIWQTIWWDSNIVDQKATCEDIYEPRPKYHWTGGMFRLSLHELPKCLHAILLWFQLWCVCELSE